MYHRLANNDEPENSSIRIPEGWLRKRKRTIIVFTIQNFLIGMEYSIFTLTLWLYITTMIETSRPKLLYGVTSSSFFIAGIILSPFYGKIVDKTRRSRMAFIVGNTATSIGNFLYAVSYSQYFLIAGRLLGGFGSPIKAIINSEIARSYPTENLTRYYSIIGVAFASGFVVGPAINSIFLHVDFKLFGLIHITNGNIVGLYMGCIYFFMNIVVTIYMSDLSREFDLKEETSKRFVQPPFQSDDTNGTYNSREKLLSFLRNGHVILLLALSFLFRYIIMGYDVSLPIVILDKLNWGQYRLNLAFLGYSLIGILTLLFTILKPPSQSLSYKIILLSEVCAIGIVASIYMTVLLKSRVQYIVSMLFIQAIFFNIMDIGEEICLPSIYSKIIPSEKQTFAEAIRLSTARFGSLVSLMTTAYACDFILEWLAIVTIVFLPIIIISLWKKQRLSL